MENGAVLPLFYLPSLEYISYLQQFQQRGIWIEIHEHFPKQTARNRTAIVGPNGKLELTIPLHKNKGNGGHTPYKDVKIANEENWQRIHWLSLETSYRSSAYFEFYEDYFAPFYQKTYQFLLDYNLELLQTLLQLLKLSINIQQTTIYQKNPAPMEDFRSSMSIKKPSDYHHKPYYQVFEDKYGKLNNLSVVDVLFNQGPQAIKFL